MTAGKQGRDRAGSSVEGQTRGHIKQGAGKLRGKRERHRVMAMTGWEERRSRSRGWSHTLGSAMEASRSAPHSSPTWTRLMSLGASSVLACPAAVAFEVVACPAAVASAVVACPAALISEVVPCPAAVAPEVVACPAAVASAVVACPAAEHATPQYDRLPRGDSNAHAEQQTRTSLHYYHGLQFSIILNVCACMRARIERREG